MKFNSKDVSYDKEQNTLKIGEINSKEVSYKFLNNAYAQIKNDKLKGLYFTEIEL